MHHLDGDGLRVFAYARRSDTMITRHGNDGLALDGWMHLPGHAGQIHRQIEQPAQGPMGHR